MKKIVIFLGVVGVILVLVFANMEQSDNSEKLREVIDVDDFMMSEQVKKNWLEQSAGGEFVTQDFFTLIGDGIRDNDMGFLSQVMYHLSHRKDIEPKFRNQLDYILGLAIEGRPTKIPSSYFYCVYLCKEIPVNRSTLDSLGRGCIFVLRNFPNVKTVELLEQALEKGGPMTAEEAVLSIPKVVTQEKKTILLERFIRSKTATDELLIEFAGAIDVAMYMVDNPSVLPSY